MTTSRCADSAPAHDRRWLAAGAATALVVAVVRLWISRGRDEFSLWPDEPAQLAMARFLGGGVPWTMHDHSTWQPGYATLLSPVHWFTDDPVTVLHLALALNAVLGGVAAWLLVALTRRLTTLGPWIGAVVAGLVALLPAAVFTTVLVWSEALLAVCFLATVLLLLRYAESPTVARGALAGLGAAVAFGTHSRMLPLAVVTIGLALVLAVRREATTRSAAGVVAVTVAAMATVKVYTGWVVDRLWDEPASTNSLGGAIEHVTAAPLTTVMAFAGQVWYLVVSTIGLVVYGAFTLVRSAAGPRPNGPEPGDPARRDALVLLAIVVFGVGPSVLFMADRYRPDQIVYGRYNDVVISPVVMIGLAFLLTAASARRIVIGAATAVGVSLVCAGALLAWRRKALESGSGIEPMIIGLQPFAGSADAIEVVRITVLSVIATIVLAAVAIAVRRHGSIGRTAVLLAATGVFVGVAGVRTADVINGRWNGRGDLSAVASLADDELAGGIDVEFLLPDGTSSDRLTLYQLYLPHNRFTVIEELADSRSTPYLFAASDDPELAGSATLVWKDPYRRFGLWQR